MNIANSLVPGSFTQPIKVSGGYKIIYLLEKKSADKPAFKLIRDSVLAEFLKRRDDNSLRQYLDNLKKWYDVSRNLPD